MLLQNFIKLSASVHELYRVHKLFALSPSGKKKIRKSGPVIYDPEILCVLSGCQGTCACEFHRAMCLCSGS